MKNTNTVSEQDAVKYRNKMNGELFYTEKKQTLKNVDGVDFVLAWCYVNGSVNPRPGWVRKDSLEKVK